MRVSSPKPCPKMPGYSTEVRSHPFRDTAHVIAGEIRSDRASALLNTGRAMPSHGPARRHSSCPLNTVCRRASRIWQIGELVPSPR